MLLPALGLAGPGPRFVDPAPVAVLQIPVSAGPLDLDGAGFIRRAQALGQAVQYWTINRQRLTLLVKQGLFSNWARRHLATMERLAPLWRGCRWHHDG